MALDLVQGSEIINICNKKEKKDKNGIKRYTQSEQFIR